MNDIPDIKSSPFLKWVGGKRRIMNELKNRLPKKFGSYYEPFVGGGALFFETKPKKSFLSDVNLDLITTYTIIKNNPDELIEKLKIYQKYHCKEYYYEMRGKHGLENPVEVAARMIYLNKTCFNGLWRVNKKGEFNVPMGSYTNPGICQEENIRACNIDLQTTTIEYKDYQHIAPKAGDFCYFDPPYHPTNETSFTAYAKNDFSEKDQKELAEFCTILHDQGVHVMISNSNTKYINELYKSSIFKIDIIDAPRSINCKPTGRKSVEEVIITNNDCPFV